MEDSNEILKALGQIPELADAAKKILEANEEFKRLFAQAMKQRVQAEVSQDGLEKVYAAAVHGVKETSCQLPDIDELSAKIADRAAIYFSNNLSVGIQGTIDKAFSGAKLRHVYTYARPDDLLDAMKPWAKVWTVVSSILCGILISFFVGIGIYQHRSEEHYGRMYMQIIKSKYITDEEYEMLRKNTYTISALPVEYEKTPKLVKQRIERNQEILEQREEEARANKGKVLTNVPLER